MSHPRILMKKSWTDKEPDTFSMRVWVSRLTGKKFLVVSGNSTWLTRKQALEVADFLQECLKVIDAGEDDE